RCREEGGRIPRARPSPHARVSTRAAVPSPAGRPRSRPLQARQAERRFSTWWAPSSYERRQERSTTLGCTPRGHAAATQPSGFALTGVKVAARSDNRRPLRERLGHLDPKEGDQTFAFRQEAPAFEQAGRDAALHGFDELPVLRPDLIVELDQLTGPAVVDVRMEEVVEEADGPAERFRPDRPDRQVRGPGIDVDLQPRPDEVERAVAAAVPCVAVLAPDRAVPFENVRVRIDVDEVTEAGMGD